MKRSFQRFFLFSLLFSASQAWSGAFSVTPVRIFFEPRDRAVAVTLNNEGDEEVALQADIHSWAQDAKGSDQLELTEDLIVSPPSLKISPRSKQVIRLALITPRDPSRQMTYRLIVREVPEATAPKQGEIQLPIALVLSMPVFITPPGAKRQIECAVVASAANALETVCENKGNAYAQIRSMELKRGDNVLATFDGVMYILPGASKSAPVKALEGARLGTGPAQLSLMFDDGKPQTIPVHIP